MPERTRLSLISNRLTGDGPLERCYVGTANGVFVLTANTATDWQATPTSLIDLDVKEVAVSPSEPFRVFAASRGKGLWRSTDAGESWSKVGADILPEMLRTVSLDPSDASTVYVGCEPAALYKSTDAGETWQEIEGVRKLGQERAWTYPVQGIPPHIRCVAVNPHDSKRIAVAAQVGGLLLTEDGGGSWRDVRDAIDIDVHTVLWSRIRPDVLYASTGGGEGHSEGYRNPSLPPKGKALYKSLDAGETWECVTATEERGYAVPVQVSAGDNERIILAVSPLPCSTWCRPLP
jgi:photosystem II stability/assembly factor-like uncharacterized protein